MFKYLYYRLYHYYERCYSFWGHKNDEWQKEDYHFSTNIALSTWQMGLVFCITMTLRVFQPIETLFHKVIFVFLIVFVSGAVFFIYNKKSFKDKMPELDEKYKYSRINKWMKTWFFAILFFSSIIIFMLFPFLFSNMLKLILS